MKFRLKSTNEWNSIKTQKCNNSSSYNRVVWHTKSHTPKVKYLYEKYDFFVFYMETLLKYYLTISLNSLNSKRIFK